MTAPYRLGIFATPCSATHYMRESIVRLGLDVGSEAAPLADGQVAWTTALHPVGTFQLRLHQVRDPARVISGLQIYAPREYFREEVSPRTNIPFSGDVVRWCVQYWMKWNEHCEWRCRVRYRIEDIHDAFPMICDLLGTQCTVDVGYSTCNTKREHYEVRTAKELCNAVGRSVRRGFIAQCRRYGYEI